MSQALNGCHTGVSKSDEWLTPPELVHALGTFDLDPASPVFRPWPTALKHYTIVDNGLMLPWEGRVWLNPPYSNDAITKWMKLMARHNNGIALTFARTETDFFDKYVFQVASTIFFFKKRIHFYTVAGTRAKKGGPAPSVLIAYGEENSQAISDAGLRGNHLPINYTPIIVVGISPTWISVVKIAINNCGDDELRKLYDVVERIAPDKVCKNPHWKAKIRQTVYTIRKNKIYENTETTINAD